MNGKLIFAVAGAFVAGASAGFFAAKKLFECKYKKQSETEIEKIRQTYLDIWSEKEPPEEKPEEKVDPEPKLSSEKKQMLEIIKEQEYDTRSNGPVIISPNEYAVYDDYDAYELVYYPKERILVDDLDCRLDPDRVVGRGNLDPFHHKDASGGLPDVIYIRDDNKACYFEVDRCDEPYDGPEKEE